MNWLAHLYLSEPNTEFRLGNVMTDALKGQRWPGMSGDFISGINCHHEIDFYTDRNAIVDRSKSRLEGNPRLRGIVVDVFYDHLLTLNWQTYEEVPMREFLDNFYKQALRASEQFPEMASEFVQSMVKSDRLARYGDLGEVEWAYGRIDSRLSDRALQAGRLVDFMPSLKEQHKNLEADFAEFFPQLMQHVGKEGKSVGMEKTGRGHGCPPEECL